MQLVDLWGGLMKVEVNSKTVLLTARSIMISKLLEDILKEQIRKTMTGSRACQLSR